MYRDSWASELMRGVSVVIRSFSASPMLLVSSLVVFSVGACMSADVGVVGTMKSMSEQAAVASSEYAAIWLASLIVAAAVPAIALAAATVASPATCGEVEMIHILTTVYSSASSADAMSAAIGA